jgi:undecaprenyl-diphosphatase
MTWIHALILGIIEGITEFLPVSSTGHLLLAEKLQWAPKQSDLFNIVIQSGAVIAVLPLFPNRVRQVFRVFHDPVARDYIMKVVLAFFITGVGGFAMEYFGFKLPETVLPIALALIIGGMAFIIVELWLAKRQTSDTVSWAAAVLVGIAQLVAAGFPGTSRSGACILFLLVLGLHRPVATEFSFLVGVPTMLAAGGLKIFKALHHPLPGAAPENWKMLALCTLISAVVSFIAVKWLLRYVQTHSFVGFGYYRILLGAAVAVLLFTNTIPA